MPLEGYSTLRSGGNADFAYIAYTAEDFAMVTLESQGKKQEFVILGSGSNVLISDKGIRGLTIINRSRNIKLLEGSVLEVDCGCWLQDVFLFAARRSLTGLEFAVGIPGTVGGALVSNAGAYRQSIGNLVQELEVISNGQRKWVEPSWMGFEYRDSRLRQNPNCGDSMLRARIMLKPGNQKVIYDEARSIQRQRISKQPPGASAGSFFKNVLNKELAKNLQFLPDHFKESGIIPAGYLIEAVGLRGFRTGRVGFSNLHANIIVNYGESSSMAIKDLAQLAKVKVLEAFGVDLEEEVLYIGDWNSSN